MRTLFDTSWAKDAWSPNLGQASSPGGNVFGDIAQTAQTAIQSVAEVRTAEAEAEAAQARAAAAAAQAQAAAAAAAAAPRQQTILGMSPTMAAIVGAATLAAVVGGVALLAKKKK